jgi:hypothetical protein
MEQIVLDPAYEKVLSKATALGPHLRPANGRGIVKDVQNAGGFLLISDLKRMGFKGKEMNKLNEPLDNGELHFVGVPDSSSYEDVRNGWRPANGLVYNGEIKNLELLTDLVTGLLDVEGHYGVHYNTIEGVTEYLMRTGREEDFARGLTVAALAYGVKNSKIVRVKWNDLVECNGEEIPMGALFRIPGDLKKVPLYFPFVNDRMHKKTKSTLEGLGVTPDSETLLH